MLPFIIVTLIIVFYYFSTKNFDYWSKRGVKFETPIPIFGNHLKNVLGLRSDVQTATELYRKYKGEKIVGYFRGNTPEIIVRDPDILKCIMVKDFQYAHSRFFGQGSDFLQQNIYFSAGNPWRPLRAKLSAAFTTNKLKYTLPTLKTWNGKLENYLKASSNTSVNTYNMLQSFITRVMGDLVFDVKGEKGDKYLDELEEVMLDFKMRQPYPALRDTFPYLSRFLGTPLRTENKLVNIVKRAFDRRSVAGNQNLILDAVIELKAEGKLVGESIEDPKNKVEVEMNDINTAAQLYTLFTASTGTLSMAITNTLLQLAHNEEIQEKLLSEIDQIKEEIDYDAIEKFSLLDRVVKESLRLYPPGGIYQRICNARYEIPGTNVVIDPGVRIMIPAQGLHMDEKYFKDPEEFRPSRFTEEEEKGRHSHVYLPFGSGPRKCIGERLARLMIASVLIAILRSHRLKPITPRVFKSKTNVFLAQEPMEDILMQFVPRESINGVAG